MPPRHLALTLLCLLPLGAGAQTVEPDAAAMARYRRASSCVAVLKQEVQTLRERQRSGSPAPRAEMQRLTEWGFAFIGTAYKAGLRKPLADQLLAEAETSVRRLPADAQRQLSQDCRAEGARLLKDASFIERGLVSNRAKARVDDLLQADAKR